MLSYVIVSTTLLTVNMSTSLSPLLPEIIFCSQSCTDNFKQSYNSKYLKIVRNSFWMFMPQNTTLITSGFMTIIAEDQSTASATTNVLSI